MITNTTIKIIGILLSSKNKDTYYKNIPSYVNYQESWDYKEYVMLPNVQLWDPLESDQRLECPNCKEDGIPNSYLAPTKVWELGQSTGNF